MHSTPDLDIRSPSSLARRLGPCAIALLLCACGGSSDPQKTMETIASWSATVRLARAELRAHGVGDVYARQLLDRARDARDDARRSLASADVPPTLRGRADSALASLDLETRLLASELPQR